MLGRKPKMQQGRLPVTMPDRLPVTMPGRLQETMQGRSRESYCHPSEMVQDRRQETPRDHSLGKTQGRLQETMPRATMQDHLLET